MAMAVEQVIPTTRQTRRIALPGEQQPFHGRFWYSHNHVRRSAVRGVAMLIIVLVLAACTSTPAPTGSVRSSAVGHQSEKYLLPATTTTTTSPSGKLMLVDSGIPLTLPTDGELPGGDLSPNGTLPATIKTYGFIVLAKPPGALPSYFSSPPGGVPLWQMPCLQPYEELLGPHGTVIAYLYDDFGIQEYSTAPSSRFSPPYVLIFKAIPGPLPKMPWVPGWSGVRALDGGISDMFTPGQFGFVVSKHNLCPFVDNKKMPNSNLPSMPPPFLSGSSSPYFCYVPCRLKNVVIYRGPVRVLYNPHP